MSVSDHYARDGLIAAIAEGVQALGKTSDTVTLEDLAAVDEFHIGGAAATAEVAAQLRLSASDHVLDIGCGLGGPARFIADRYGCRVTGIDITRDYVEAGATLSGWVGLDRRVSLHVADALAMPFPDSSFSAAYMLHAGMNIADKMRLFSEASRVLATGARFAIYDVMLTGEGNLSYPLPWGFDSSVSAVATPETYKTALRAAGFTMLHEKSCRDAAVEFFAQQRAEVARSDGPPPLGLHILLGERRPHQVRNMIEGITAGRIAPVEIIAQKT